MDDLDLDGPIGSNSAAADDDLTLPKGNQLLLEESVQELIVAATVAKLISEMLPDDIVCAKETRDLVLDCCVEFIHLLASEANEVCEKTTKKTISADHLFQALRNLGFEEFLDEVKQEHGLHKQDQKVNPTDIVPTSDLTTPYQQDRETKKAASTRFGDSGMTEEQLLKQQEELFKQARQKYEQRILMTQQENQTSPAESPIVDQLPTVDTAAGAAEEKETH